MLVQTTVGLLDKSLLEIKDVVTEEDNARVIATEWFYGGEMVRRDVSVSILRGIEIAGTAQEI